jgi:hypothetical protein
MEFDNDRIRKHANKIEIFYWVLLGFASPLVNALAYFPLDFKMWPVLVMVNLVLMPAYLFYALFIIPRLLFRDKYLMFWLSSPVFFILVHVIVFSLYGIISRFGLSAPEHAYFTYNLANIAREALWSVIYMAMATAISFIKKELDEKDLVVNLQKDNISFKLKYLRAQLNPHFLFNTLNSIYSLSLAKIRQGSRNGGKTGRPDALPDLRVQPRQGPAQQRDRVHRKLHRDRKNKV